MNYNSIDNLEFWKQEKPSTTIPSRTSSISSQSTLMTSCDSDEQSINATRKRKYSIESLISSLGMTILSNETDSTSDSLTDAELSPLGNDSLPTLSTSSLGRRMSLAVQKTIPEYQPRRRYSVMTMQSSIPTQFYRFGIHIELSIVPPSDKPYTLYLLTIRRINQFGANVTKVQRRYSVFRNVYKRLLSQYPKQFENAPEFPTRSIFGKSVPFIRKNGLEKWIQFVICHPDLYNNSILNNFLSVDM